MHTRCVHGMLSWCAQITDHRPGSDPTLGGLPAAAYKRSYALTLRAGRRVLWQGTYKVRERDAAADAEGGSDMPHHPPTAWLAAQQGRLRVGRSEMGRAAWIVNLPRHRQSMRDSQCV